MLKDINESIATSQMSRSGIFVLKAVRCSTAVTIALVRSNKLKLYAKSAGYDPVSVLQDHDSSGLMDISMESCCLWTGSAAGEW